MNSNFHAAAAALAVDRVAFTIALAVACLGCKATPTNPFAEQAKAEQAARDQAAAQAAVANSDRPTAMGATPAAALAAESAELSRLGAGAALAAVGLGKEVEAAAKDAASRVKLAAANTLANETAEAERVATHAAATAEQAAGAAKDLAVERAYAALDSASADARREACNYLAEHADPRHVQVLLRAMADPQAAVKLAAIRALGAIGRLDDPRPLVDLLDAPDKIVRVEAALALVRLRVEQGTAALERLALDSDFEIRLRAARAMGEIADPLFLPALVAMLGDQPEVRQAAMASLTRIAGGDMAGEQGAARGTVATSDEERARRWQQWYAQRPSANARR